MGGGGGVEVGSRRVGGIWGVERYFRSLYIEDYQVALVS